MNRFWQDFKCNGDIFVKVCLLSVETTLCWRSSATFRRCALHRICWLSIWPSPISCWCCLSFLNPFTISCWEDHGGLVTQPVKFMHSAVTQQFIHASLNVWNCILKDLEHNHWNCIFKVNYRLILISYHSNDNR